MTLTADGGRNREEIEKKSMKNEVAASRWSAAAGKFSHTHTLNGHRSSSGAQADLECEEFGFYAPTLTHYQVTFSTQFSFSLLFPD